MPTCNLCPPDLKGCHLCCTSGPHLYILQRPYISRQGARMERAFETNEITFQKGEQCGIPVKDAIAKSFKGLKNRDSRPFEGADVADQAILRMEWPGYLSWNSTFRTRDSTPTKTPVTLSRLATDVSKSIEKFINEMEGEVCTEPEWRVGRDHINVDTLVLVSLQRASYGSWVATIRLV